MISLKCVFLSIKGRCLGNRFFDGFIHRTARKLNKEDAVDRCKWRKVVKEVRWPGWVWAGECFFWYRPGPTRVVPVKRPLNGCCCCSYSQNWFSSRQCRQGLDLQNILRQSYDYLTIMQKLRSTLIMRRTMAGVCRFLESRTMYHVIGKVAACAVVCITVMDSARSTSINEHGCNFSCAVIVRYIARDPARQLRDACVTREVRLG